MVTRIIFSASRGENKAISGSEIKISCHKYFLKHKNSTISVERNFFSQLARFRAILFKEIPPNFFFFHYFSFTCEGKVMFLLLVKEK